jgi:hypothetical protein
MKRILITFFQFVLFFVAFAAGSFLSPFHLRQVVSVTAAGTRIFVWDGVVLMAVVLFAILLIEAMRKRIRVAIPGTALAFVLAGAAGLAIKLGFMTI